MTHPTTGATGILTGKTITLDSPVPALDGRRVRVVIESAEEDIQLSKQEQLAAWQEWIRSGEQGPLEQDEDPEFP